MTYEKLFDFFADNAKSFDLTSRDYIAPERRWECNAELRSEAGVSLKAKAEGASPQSALQSLYDKLQPATMGTGAQFLAPRLMAPEYKMQVEDDLPF